MPDLKLGHTNLNATEHRINHDPPSEINQIISLYNEVKPKEDRLRALEGRIKSINNRFDEIDTKLNQIIDKYDPNFDEGELEMLESHGYRPSNYPQRL